ncbi:MAG: transcriptional regulator [Planctomycetaceae bacterium]
MLRVIDLLQSGRMHNSNDLAQACNVSRRTIFRDISMLQRAGLNIVLDDDRQGYYLPHRLTFPPSELSVSEALSLLLICQELGGTEGGVPFQAAARSGAWKVCQNLPQHVRTFLGEAAGALSIQLDAHNPLSAAQPQYEAMVRSLLERRQIRVEYHAAGPEGRLRTVLEPYRILFRRRSWYVVGRSTVHRQVRVFNIGRIQSTEILDRPYEVPPRFNLERFLGNAWNLIRDPHGAVDVVIRFSPQMARNVAEVRWHKTQQTTELPDGRLEFRARVDGIEEISWWILGYGAHAEVLEPVSLRTLLRDHAERMLRRYSSPEKPSEPADSRTVDAAGS